MALFGLFEKKTCDICGGKIGMLGNNKLADGNMCNDCAEKLSTWFKREDRENCTVAQIKECLASREQNAALLAQFHPTKLVGDDDDPLVKVDENLGRFIVLREGEQFSEHPDLLELSRVRDVKLEIETDKTEIRYKNPVTGRMERFSPNRHYHYNYKFYITIDYDGQWFKEVKFSLNTLGINGGTDGEEYKGNTLGDFIQTEFMNAFNLHRDPAYTPWDKDWRLDYGGFVVDRRNHRVDLKIFPGGYRADGFTTMTPLDRRRYEELNAIGEEILKVLSPRSVDGGDAPVQEPVNNSDADGNVWTCSSCGTGNTGRFCINCGTPKP